MKPSAMRAYQEMLYGVSRNDDSTKERWRRLIPQRAITAVRSELGLFYLWRGCLPDAETAFYFSGATYATIGYGDVVLAKPWRLLAPIEGLMGILMCGLSAGYLFAVLSHVYQSRHVEAPAVSITNRAQ